MTSLPIALPNNCSVLVSIGDVVKSGQIIAERKSSQVGKILPVAEFLNVSPKSTKKYLKKSMGDRIQKGDIIAEKKSLIGGKKLISPYSGTIFKLEEEKGELYVITEGSDVQSSDTNTNVFSPVEGKVISCDNGKIVLETDKKAISCIESLGNSGSGELLIVEDKQGDEDIDYNSIPPQIEGKVIIGKEFQKAAVYKAIAMGVSGVITSEAGAGDFTEYKSKNVKVPVVKVDLESFEKLVRLNGKTVYLEPDKNLIIL